MRIIKEGFEEMKESLLDTNRNRLSASSNMNLRSRYIEGTDYSCGTIRDSLTVSTNGRTLRYDNAIGLVVSLQISIMSVKNILVVSHPLLLKLNNVLNASLFFIIGVLYLWGFRFVCRRLRKTTIAVLICSTVIICTSALMFNENIPFISELLPRTILYSFLGLLYMSSMNDFECFLNYMVRFSYGIVFASIVGAYMFMRNVGMGHLDSQYSMALSYSTSIGVMFLLYKYVQDGIKTDLLMVISGIFVIILFGSRMNLANTLSYVALAYVRRIKNSAKSGIHVVLLFILGCLAVLNIDAIATALNTVLISRGIYSRTLALFLSGRIMHLSSRDVIYETVLREFYKRPLVGIGVGGSHVVAGTGVHSMYFEIFATLGLIVGSIVFAFLFYTVAKGLRLSRGTAARELIWIYLCLVIPRGFVGGGLWENQDLWRLLGVSISSIANARRNKDDYTD